MNVIQKQLNALYLDYLKKLTTDIELGKMLEIERICPPVLLDVNTTFGQFLDAELKILYVGKENNGWMNREERKKYGLNEDYSDTNVFLNASLELYKDFNLGRKYRRSFYTFLDMLFEEIRKRNSKTGILWSNLIRVDCVDRNNLYESYELKKKVILLDGNKILREEISILKPDVVIFVTGPSYDDFLRESFPGISLLQVGNFGLNEVCRLEHDELPKTSLRIYHPGYHNRLGKDYKFKLTRMIHDTHFETH